jgi:imidazole glycerol-phosphate synthase subunit HisF
VGEAGHTLPKRIIVCISLRDGRAVMRSQADYRETDDPVELAAQQEAAGADEVMLIDMSGSAQSKPFLVEAVRRAAERLSVPVLAGGGVAEVDDIASLLQAGAARVAINTSAVKRPELISEASRMFGKQAIIASIGARREKRAIEQALRQQVTDGSAQAAPEPEDWYRVFTHQGEAGTQLDAVQWATQCVTLGAGEILMTNVDREDSTDGYDLELIARVVEAVPVPVIASGGVGRAEHVRDAFVLAGSAAALVSLAFVQDAATLRRTKRLCADAGVAVRLEDGSSPLVAE